MTSYNNLSIIIYKNWKQKARRKNHRNKKFHAKRKGNWRGKLKNCGNNLWRLKFWKEL